MKISKTTLLIASTFLALFVFNSCKDDDIVTPPDTNPFENLVLVGEQNTGVGSYVKIYADEALFVGYNNLYITLFDSASNEQITNGCIDLVPMMDMMTMKHSAPFVSPGDILDPQTRVFKGAVVFTMPSGSHGTWSLKLHINNYDAQSEVDVSVSVTVVAKSESRLLSFVRKSDSASMFVTLIEPVKPEVGLNKITYGVYTKKTMMDFPPVEDLNMEIDPQMLSMGHGSPNNVNPTYKANGIYEGTVNFTMSGKWTVFTLLKDENNTAMGDTLLFDITLH
jgi:hypothetical protein